MIDFQNTVCFYVDSEGVFNVLSEDEDFADAQTYSEQHNLKSFKCTIVPKKFYEDIKTEQMESDLNQSVTWQSSMHNQWHEKAKREKKARKQKGKHENQMNKQMEKIEEMVRQRVQSELERERVAMSARGDMSQATLPLIDQSMISNADSVSIEQTAAYRENLPKMAVLISSEFMDVEVIEGREILLEFTVQNNSEMAWPFKPFVQNERDKAVKQLVDAQL